MSDPVELAQPWLEGCAPCDFGLPSRCTCPPGDIRGVMVLLIEEIHRLRALKEPA